MISDLISLFRAVGHHHERKKDRCTNVAKPAQALTRTSMHLRTGVKEVGWMLMLVHQRPAHNGFMSSRLSVGFKVRPTVHQRIQILSSDCFHTKDLVTHVVSA
jgi:hypothetical protein